jgi:hypothetical protein
VFLAPFGKHSVNHDCVDMRLLVSFALALLSLVVFPVVCVKLLSFVVSGSFAAGLGPPCPVNLCRLRWAFGSIQPPLGQWGVGRKDRSPRSGGARSR